VRHLKKLQKSLVSVVLPVRDGEDTVSRCLNSVLRQDYVPLEVVVVDDGSKDRTLDRIKDASAGRDNVRVLTHKENQGLAHSLNDGILEACGDLILTIHVDCEIVETSFVSQAVKLLETDREIAAVTGRRVYPIEDFCAKEKLFMVANGHLAEMDSDGETEELTFLEGKCDVFRRSIIESLGGFPANRFRVSGEDQIVSSRIRSKGFKLVKLGSISYLLSFGQKESSISGILSKLRLYGRSQAGVLWTERGLALKGISRSQTLSKRAANRLEMTIGASAMLAGLLLSFISPYFLLLALGACMVRCSSYVVGLRRLQAQSKLAFLGPILDIYYSFGFLEGLLFSSIGKKL
jgi:glycosyltransferase involved in cell wall biosynthesis